MSRLPTVPILLALVVVACAPPSSDPTPGPTPTALPPSPAPWQPAPGLRWQIQFTGEIETRTDADVFDLDLFDTDPALLADLHARGKHVVCYLNAGAWEDWRPDASLFPQEILGKKYSGWPGERWLDIRRLDLLAPILSARLDLCQSKGFDGVEPDNLDGFANRTGFPLTAEDQLRFNRWLADEAHARSLAIGLKNDPEQAAELEPWFDFALTEDCFAQGWCNLLHPFLAAGKPVIAVEYTDTGIGLSDICAQASALGIDALLKHRELDAWLQPCPPAPAR